MASKAQFDAELTRIKGVISNLKAERDAARARVVELEAQVASGGIPAADESAFLTALTAVESGPPSGGEGDPPPDAEP